MKILIASDLHGSTYSSEKILSLDNKFNFEKIILLGDINYSGARNVPPSDYYPINVCKNLSLLKDKLILIRGNCDSRVDEFVLGIEFKDKIELDIKNHHLVLTHGDLYSENDFNFNKGDIFMYGHTHIYVLERNNEHFVLNPGSLTLPKNNNPKTYAIYDTDKEEILLFDIDDKLIKTLAVD